MTAYRDTLAVYDLDYKVMLSEQQNPPPTAGGWCPSCDDGKGWNWHSKAEVRSVAEADPNDNLEGYYRDDAVELCHTHWLSFRCGYCGPICDAGNAAFAERCGKVRVGGDDVRAWCHDELPIEVVDIPELRASCLVGCREVG